MSFAREAVPFVLPPLLVAILLVATGHLLWALPVFIVAFLLLLFFRVPRVEIVPDPGLVLAPAYGRVTRIDCLEQPELGDGVFSRIVIFLSIFDVHIQRCPVSGRVKQRRYRSGRKVAAFREQAGEVNESQLSVVEDDQGRTVAVRQVVGLLARRIVCYLREGQEVQRGDSLGLIKFGSRVDLLLPNSYTILVRPGDRLRAGETAVARPVETNEP